MAPKTKGLSNTNQCRASNLHGCGFDATKALILFFPRSGADLDQLGWSQQRLRQLRRINQPLDEWQKPPHRLAMKQQTSGDQRRVWNRRAAARADVDLPSAADTCRRRICSIAPEFQISSSGVSPMFPSGSPSSM